MGEDVRALVDRLIFEINTSLATALEVRAALPSDVVDLSTSEQVAFAFAKGSGRYRILPGTYVGNFVVSGNEIDVLADGVTFKPGELATPALVVLGSRVSISGPTVLNGYAGGDTLNVGNNAIASIDALPHDVLLDHVGLVAGEGGGKRAFGLHGVNVTLRGCEAHNFWRAGQDSQGVWINNGPGPYTIDGGYYEASGENILVGGALPGILSPDGIPSDITVRRAHLFKPLLWKTTEWRALHPGTVKNLFELKCGRRVLVEECVLENCWKDAQAGSAILLKSDGQGAVGQTPWMETSDVTFRTCKLLNSPDAFAVNALGVHPNNPTVRTRNLVFENCLFDGVNAGVQSGNGVDGLTVRRCTFLTPTGTFLSFYDDETTKCQTPLDFEANVTYEGAYGVKGSGAACGNPSLLAYCTPDSVFTGNVIERGAGHTYPYPVGQTFYLAGGLAAQLDPATRRYLPGGAGCVLP